MYKAEEGNGVRERDANAQCRRGRYITDSLENAPHSL